MKPILLVSCILLAAPSTAAAQGGLRTPSGTVTAPDRRLDPNALPDSVNIALLEKSVADLKQQLAATQADIAKLQQRDTNIDSTVNLAFKRIGETDAKLATVAQAIGKVPPHTHQVMVSAPQVSCGPDGGVCSVTPGGYLSGSTTSTK